ncbi:MAG: hypothetical protein JWO19_2253 [Bryobacterales bacterium]|nr:hypothetical protein [Bryobacterales bacterium]
MKSKTRNPLPKKTKSKQPAAPPNPPPAEPEYPATEQGLTEAFFDTDEVNAYIDATDKIREAQKRGDKEVSLPTEFLYNSISNIIPFSDGTIVDAWNRCCDLVGLPEKKRGVEGPTGDDMFLRHHIQVGHALRYKNRDNKPRGEEDPF